MLRTLKSSGNFSPIKLFWIHSPIVSSISITLSYIVKHAVIQFCFSGYVYVLDVLFLIFVLFHCGFVFLLAVQFCFKFKTSMSILSNLSCLGQLLRIILETDSVTCSISILSNYPYIFFDIPPFMCLMVNV